MFIPHCLIPEDTCDFQIKKVGSGALSAKMLLVRIVVNTKIDAFFRVVRLSKG